MDSTLIDPSQLMKRHVRLLDHTLRTDLVGQSGYCDYTRSSQNEEVSIIESHRNNNFLQNETNTHESQLMTRPRDFISKQNPLKLKREDQAGTHVWFGSFWDPVIMSTSSFNSIMDSQEIFIENAALHLKGWQLMFGSEEEDQEARPMLVKQSQGVCFLKVYLVPIESVPKLLNYLGYKPSTEEGKIEA